MADEAKRPMTEARKKANAKWDSENMTTLGCKVKREEAAAFKAYATIRGKTSNTLLKEYVIGCIGKNEVVKGEDERASISS